MPATDPGKTVADLSQAVSDIRFIASRFKGFLAAADVIDQFSSIQNGIAEAQRRLGDLATAEEDARGKAMGIIADAKRRAKETDEQAKAAALEASRNAASILDDARATAGDVIADAQKRAADIVADAEAVAAVHANKTAMLAQIDEHIKDRRAEHNIVVAKIEQATATHAAIVQMIADLKAKLPG